MNFRLLGILIDTVVFLGLSFAGVRLGSAHVISFLAAAYFYFAKDSTLRNYCVSETGWCRMRCLGVLCFLLLLVCLRGAALGFAVIVCSCPLVLAFSIVIVLTYASSIVIPKKIFGLDVLDENVFLRLAPWLAGYALILRFLFMGIPELMPEEAYYWQYAQHLAPGYLDHPPMVACLIAMGTAVFGQTEFGVRIAAFLCWILACVFMYLFAKRLYDKSVAKITILLMALLPYFLCIGLVMFPEAPLVLCWAAVLYFAHRALLDQRKIDWLGLGVCMGLGLLSKYTIALLGVALLVLMLLHRPSRHWLRSSTPYFSALFAFIAFLPVIYWNMTHEWASFAFQSTRRLETQTVTFGLPSLLLWILLLITPSGLMAAALAITKAFKNIRTSEARDRNFNHLFVLVTALIPLSVFVLFSLRHEPKPNWTGPLCLALLPAIAYEITSKSQVANSKFGKLITKSWLPVVCAALLFLSLGFHYLGLGFPFIGYTDKMNRFIGWSDLGSQIREVHRKVSLESEEPVIVGMDKHIISSELGFYMPEWNIPGQRRLPIFAGRNIFGSEALMWRFWSPASELLEHKNVLMIARSKTDLDDRIVSPFLERLDPVVTIDVRRNQSVSGQFYYRVGYNYHLK